MNLHSKMMSYPRRSKTRPIAHGLEIATPAPQSPFWLGLLAVWLIGWVAGEIFGAWMLLTAPEDISRLFVAVWLLGWTLGGGVALNRWLWMLVGEEVLQLRSNVLVVKRHIFGLGPAREYQLERMRDLHVVPGPWGPFSSLGLLQFRPGGAGRIAFNYDSRTVRIGDGVNEIEAQKILNELKTQYPFANTGT